VTVNDLNNTGVAAAEDEDPSVRTIGEVVGGARFGDEQSRNREIRAKRLPALEDAVAQAHVLLYLIHRPLTEADILEPSALQPQPVAITPPDTSGSNQ
jgi:hypothetical protein